MSSLSVRAVGVGRSLGQMLDDHVNPVHVGQMQRCGIAVTRCCNWLRLGRSAVHILSENQRKLAILARADAALCRAWSRGRAAVLRSGVIGKPNFAQAGFTLIELMIVVAMIAILAVVAVPQYTKYLRSAKATEVVMMLDLIKKGGAAYYVVPRVADAAGTNLPCQFPKKVGPTPLGASCCTASSDSDKDGRCDTNPGAWHGDTWSALRFRITDQHYYQYAFDSSGVLSKAVFTAEGFGDLDCDGVQSTFQLVVHGDVAATNAECDTVGTAGFFRDNETE